MYLCVCVYIYIYIYPPHAGALGEASAHRTPPRPTAISKRIYIFQKVPNSNLTTRKSLIQSFL